MGEIYNRTRIGNTALSELLDHLEGSGDYVFSRIRSEERPPQILLPEAVFWKNQILAGLHFPPSPFFIHISRAFRVPLNRLNPAAIRKAAFFHEIMTMWGVENTGELFFRTHMVKARKDFAYFNPLFPAAFYGVYASIDKNWQDYYFKVLPPPGRAWGGLAAPVTQHLDPKQFRAGPKPTSAEIALLVEVGSALGAEHVLPRFFTSDLPTLSFFDLRVGHPWTSDMGTPIVLHLCMFFPLNFYVFSFEFMFSLFRRHVFPR